MSLIEKFKALFEEQTKENFADYKLADGTIVRAEALEPGMKLEVIGEDGETTPAPEGEHELEDGSKVIVDAEGMIKEVIEAETEDSGEEEKVVEEKMAEVETQEAEVETPEAEVEKEDVKKDETPEVESRITELEETILMIMDKLKDFENGNNELSEENKKLNEEMSAIKEENKALKETTPSSEKAKFKKIDSKKESEEVKENTFASMIREFNKNKK